ncbi:MAG: DUF1156 domain-containing protein [Candidatus Hydrogenedentes bacterium]|nr:DUF1156 domain-containing protein [Candidatus Hydrogenedentota bacterium]
MGSEDKPRLIEVAFPLKQTSIDSVHEKNVRHGHISTLHIWPARRPLAACRAALIATLLPDPGNEEERQKILERLAGKVVKKVQKDGSIKEETEGGILHWGRESGPDLEWFRQEIRKAYGGRAPKVLDPFAGGGAIPLEAMRLGCEATAIDINPVAWFILKCTLEYPQKLAGQKLPLPDFAVHDPEFMEAFLKGTGGKKASKSKVAAKAREYQMELLPPPDADLAWHVRAWGLWVLKQARKELAPFYPTYADYQPLQDGGGTFEKRSPRLVPLDADGNADVHVLNMDYDAEYLKHPQNPRWIAKPTVAYLWARTVKCKNCRAIIPLLKTRWLCRKEGKRVVLGMRPNADKSGVEFDVYIAPSPQGGNATQKREFDKKLGAGTLSNSGAKCPCCPAIMTMEDIQQEALSGKWSEVPLAVVVNGRSGKEYRATQSEELRALERSRECAISDLSGDLMDEPIASIRPSPNARGLSGLTRYGIETFGGVFSIRQRLTLTKFAAYTRATFKKIDDVYSEVWSRAIGCELALAVDRVADRNSVLCHWGVSRETIVGTFQRYALRVNWDFCEVNPFGLTSGNYIDAIEWIAKVVQHATAFGTVSGPAKILLGDSRQSDKSAQGIDLVLTDPPYYDAIPYADLSDFFYVWLRRMHSLTFPQEFSTQITPKTQELIQHAARGDGDNERAKDYYELGMAETFSAVHQTLSDKGRFVIVFANKHPDAWETLVAAVVRSGFLVDASWPIQTEMPHKAAGGARLASSVWLVCKKRSPSARSGWENAVLDEMRVRITERLRYFWDAGIRGPDFVWAATGPALEAYSKHPVVRKADQPGATMSVSEFLRHVRRMVVDFAVGRILTHGEGEAVVTGLDDVTIYYLLHRNDFGLDEAPSGACIMYALSCGLSDRALADQFDIIKTKDSASDNGSLIDGVEDEDEELAGEDDEPAGDGVSSGGKVKLVPWNKRTKKTLGLSAPGGRPVPLIDQVHRLMHLWKAKDVVKVDEYLDERALRNDRLFHQLLQALIELAPHASQERSLLESISNHVRARGERHEDKTIGSTEVYE